MFLFQNIYFEEPDARNCVHYTLMFSNCQVMHLPSLARDGIQISVLQDGFIDGDETGVIAAARELSEEAGLRVEPNLGKLFYKGVVADKRTTAHAWADTSAVLFRIPNATPLTAGDDAKSAHWFYLDEINEQLFGSHAELVRYVMESYP